MLIIAIIEYYFLSLPHIHSPNSVIKFIKSFFVVAFILNLVFGPLAFLWFGTLFSPVNKKKTSFTIATILSVTVIYLFIRPYMEFDPVSFLSYDFLFIGICHAGIIWILAIGTYRRITWVYERSKDDVRPWVISGSNGVAIFVLLFLMSVLFPIPLSSPRQAWMSRAKGTLRSTGSSQLAYQDTNDKKDFGSFEALKNTLYIAEGYNLGNIIENYSMTWSVYNTPDISDMGTFYGVHTFTVVAYPRDSRPGYLMTFGVTEDQVVRMFNPDNLGEGLNEFKSMWDPRVQTWDPIL
ncbi:MAG: hypothetical protein NTY09_06655 [bacterium]|nr:hypothetical protein [bacterium]